jgi:uncharacterized protein YjbI with pentapeptide repeats
LKPLAAPTAPRLEDADRSEQPRELPAVVSGARLVAPDVPAARFTGLRLTDVAVEGGDLANVAAPELQLNRVTLTGVRLTGASWTRGRIADTAFRDCRIDLATFAGTTFERVTFTGCLLAQADFREGLWRSVRLEDCELGEADLTGLRIDRAELRGCALDGLAGAERLRGAAMPWGDVLANAALLAGALGIRVLDGD